MIPVEQTALRPIATLRDLATTLAADARQQGFFGHGDALTIDADTNTAWAVRNDPNHRGSHGGNETNINPYAGIYTSRAGAVSIFQALPRVTLGSLVNEHDLTQRITVLLRHVVPYLPDAANVTVAAAIDPADWVAEGNPTDVGGRSQGSFGLNRTPGMQAPPADQIASGSFAPHLHEVARELATRLMIALQSAPR